MHAFRKIRSKKMEQACKPSSVSRLSGRRSLIWVDGCPSTRAAYPNLISRRADAGSCLALQPVGFTLPNLSPDSRCALTAPFHPYPRLKARAVFFLWHCPWDRSRWPLAITAPCAARTFLRNTRVSRRPPRLLLYLSLIHI